MRYFCCISKGVRQTSFAVTNICALEISRNVDRKIKHTNWANFILPTISQHMRHNGIITLRYNCTAHYHTIFFTSSWLRKAISSRVVAWAAPSCLVPLIAPFLPSSKAHRWQQEQPQLSTWACMTREQMPCMQTAVERYHRNFQRKT